MTLHPRHLYFWCSRPKLAILSLLATGFVSGAPGPSDAGEIIRTSQNQCTAIGRIILSWDAGIQTGTWVCENDVVKVGKNLRVDLLCLTQRSVASLTGGEHPVANRCQMASQQPPQRCSVSSRLSCTRLRGDLNLTSPWLKAPYGNVFVSSPRQIEWHALPQADTYQVYIEGEGRVWQLEQQQASLDLATRDIVLEPEGTYLLTIVALSDDQILAKRTHVFNLLSAVEENAVKTRIQAVQASRLPMTAQAYLMTQIYWEEGLYDQGVKHLEALQRQYPSKPEILMLLGDRYLHLGQYELAEQTYQSILGLPNSDAKIAAQKALENLSRTDQSS